MNPTIHRCGGAEVQAYLKDAARLRISVFREFPYLYEGAEESEKGYMEVYAQCPGAVFVVAAVAEEVVGISTGLPLSDADGGFRQPFESEGYAVGEWFYFGESVLAPEWRGKGIGHRFFDEREAHAMSLGYRKFTFCSVRRPNNHPLRPEDYHPHDAFWTRRGYVERPALVATFPWVQIDSDGAEVENELVFWTRELPE